MADVGELLRALEGGQLYRFRDWPNRAVPQLAAGVYTIWREDGLIYVGMAGRSLTAEHIAAGQANAKRGGLSSRLGSHASGRRSGDQFCVYVADRLVLPSLTPDEIAAIGNGRHSLDALVRTYIHAHLSYRFLIVEGGAEARTLEALVREGALRGSAPLLNPSKARSNRSSKFLSEAQAVAPVLAAVISRNGSVLIAKRPHHKRHGGLWEFPGGKIHAGESLLEAARRELNEELGMSVTSVGRILFEQQDPGSSFLIRFIEVEADGEPEPKEHDEVAWVVPHELASYTLAPTDGTFAATLAMST